MDFQKEKLSANFLNKLLDPTKIVFIDDKLYNWKRWSELFLWVDPSITYQGLHLRRSTVSLPFPPISESTIEAKWKKLLEKAKFFIEEPEELCITNN